MMPAMVATAMVAAMFSGTWPVERIFLVDPLAALKPRYSTDVLPFDFACVCLLVR